MRSRDAWRRTNRPTPDRRHSDLQRAGHLAETIASILSQEGVDFELVVSDDRSDDETLAVVRAVAGDRARIEVNSERLAWRETGTGARPSLAAIGRHFSPG